ncbi:restriction endonuclease subunit S [Arcicella lustrica]|uniref:Restriction endonuclease subunit S n=1 Tax=Arcicella lustrica TaxID=2984196 RepID=A0ABU5SQN6_9BACT|nr:restriction endonuclease subunit S [Arcicella sp. DC25W]MEA5429219.1 restriction endonuclease subunit S [Arcicella sp. DC25W]
MSKNVKLNDIASYSNTRIKISDITLDTYITTDNLLQNKAGICKATNLPPQDGTMPAYQKNDILIGNIRPYLKKIWFADRNGGASPDVLVLNVHETYDPKYVYYTLFRDDFFDHVMKGSKGTKMPRGDKSQVLDFLIPDFDLPTQQKIASVLSSLDAKIELNNRINAELEAMAKTLYDYWFVQFDFPNAEGKPYKSSGGAMVWSEDLKREIPEGWKVGTLLDIATYTNGLACQKYRPVNDDTLRVIKIREMKDGFSASSELVRVDIPEKVIVENGDVLFSWSASLEVIVWAKGRGALNQHIFKVTSEKYPKSFYYYQLVNYLQHFKMLAENRKTTMGHITQEHLQQSRIAVPSSDGLIKLLDEKITPILDKQIAIEQENQQLTQLRDWLLPMLMNGQVVVE